MAASIRFGARIGNSRISARNLGASLLNHPSDFRTLIYQHVKVSHAQERCVLGRSPKYIAVGTPVWRWFVEHSGAQTCWNCNKTVSFRDLLCKSCDSLQKVNENLNYFEVFGESPRYDLDEKRLQETFHDLQRILHPDRFTKKSEKEKKYSDDHSAFVNLAYQVISKPEKRAFYLLRLHGKDLDAVQLDSTFLAYMMELNEQLSENNKNVDLAPRLLQEVNKNLEKLSDELSTSFANNELDKACLALAKIKYFRNVEDKLKEQLRNHA
ncbi:iron-sulfur cluster co-chaperone protein HscB-like [Ornithodoros turicata]|uniref:iron-sulfur cluster co-chaperone protein HscB-like n=1 Tax=Ornithodoros turicata TaxID=34597 RepID=UPI0031395BA2